MCIRDRSRNSQTSPGETVNKSQYFLVGEIGKPHGTKGELRVSPYSDYPEISFAPGTILRLGNREGRLPHSPVENIKVLTSRIFRNGLLVLFDDVFDRSMARSLTGKGLFLSADEVAELQKGEYFWHDLVGMEVADLKGDLLGEVSAVYELAPLDLLEVSGPESSFMIPCSREIVVSVDVEGKRIVLDPPEGLLDL